ncbi:lysophospholipid acyltransferase family protein [Microbacterium kribbense]|uniref:Lysophospholipid acyltransferase family protein n=1 Tax=Microbacterium kribbense TaxID=433645 RepID=A0ABP7GJS0_9MICO
MAWRTARSRGTSERTWPSAFWTLAAIVVPPISLLAKIRIVDGHKLPREGPFVLAVNHYSELDAVMVAVAVWRLRRLPRFLAKESLFHVPVLGWALRATGMVPVGRTGSSADAQHTLDVSQALVEHGRGVIVYPEGTLTRDPDLWPMRGKTGAVRLALAGDIPLIPVAQWGAQEIMPRYGKIALWPLRRPVTVVFGDPIDLAGFHSDGKPAPATLSRATTVVMDRIAEMLSTLRGIPAPAQRWNPAEHGQKETGRLDP